MTKKMDADLMDVNIILMHKEIPQADKSVYYGLSIPAMKSRLEKKVYEPFRPFVKIRDYKIKNSFPILDTDSDFSICFRIKITNAKLRQLAFDPDIASIEEAYDVKPTATPTQTWINNAYNPPSMTHLGGGINCATIEIGLSDAFLNCLGITRNSDDLGTGPLTYGYPLPHEYPQDYKDHCEAVFWMMKQTSPQSTPHHFADYCHLGNPIFYAARNWIQQHIIMVASESYAHTGTSNGDFDNRVQDWFAFQEPRYKSYP